MKPTISLIALMTCILLSAVAAQSTTQPANAEQEIRSVIQEIDSALKAHDRSKLEKFMAGDFAMLHSTGKLEGPESFLRRAAAGSLVSQRVPGEVVEDAIRIYRQPHGTTHPPDQAQVHPPHHAPVEMSLRSIDVYVKIEGRWLWV